MRDKNEILDETYKNLIKEAELFFVSKFITYPSIDKMYKDCLDIVFDITGTVDTAKGICAFNEQYGQGKTFVFELINHRYKRKYGQNLFKRTSAKDLCDIFVKDGKTALIAEIKVKNLFIDDIGDEGENKVFKHYGEELNVLRYVLLKRYEFWLSNGWRTYATTNLNLQQMGNEYDGRVADRFAQMVHWLSFSFLNGDKSFRQYSGTRRLKVEEIKANLEKLKDTVVEERVDVTAYMNDLLQESDDYLNVNDFTRWGFVKDFLVEKTLLDVSDIPMDLLEHSRTLAALEKKRDSDSRYRHAGTAMQVTQRMKAQTVKTDVIKIAEALMAKQKFMELRTNGYKF